MNTQEIFKNQIEGGASEMFFYGLEKTEPYTLSIGALWTVSPPI